MAGGSGGNNSGNSAGASNASRGPLRSLKDFINTTIRMLDRVGLRTYISLMEKELSAAKVCTDCPLNACMLSLITGCVMRRLRWTRSTPTRAPSTALTRTAPQLRTVAQRRQASSARVRCLRASCSL